MGAWVTYGIGSESQRSAGLRRAAIRPARPARRQLARGQRLSADDAIKACRFAAGRADPAICAARPALTRDRERAVLRRRRRAQPGPARGDRRSGNRHADRRLRNGVPHADERAGADGPRGRNAGDARRSTAPSRASRRSPTTACSRGGWSSAACGSCSSITPTGTITATRPTTSASRSTQRCREVDQAAAALVLDLKQRGLLERHARHLGRRIRPHADGRSARKPIGRDHHIDAFTMWLAGGGIKPGSSSARPTSWASASSKDNVHVHDLHATILHLLGLDHEKLTYRFQGRDFRLTDVHGKVVQELMA